jgi:hypothetical protein
MTRAELAAMKVQQLRSLAGELGVPGRTDMNKVELIDALIIPFLEARINGLEERIARLEAKA